MKTVANVLGVARSNLAVQAEPTAVRQRRGRRPQPDAALLAEIKELIAELPTYGYRRVHALLRRRHEQTGEPAVNVKRVYRVMKSHSLLLQRHSGAGIERRHDGRIAVDQSDTRWCSDGFEIGCDNSLPLRKQGESGCASRSPWIAVTAARSPGSPPPAASRAMTSVT
jgi:putative transposase